MKSKQDQEYIRLIVFLWDYLRPRRRNQLKILTLLMLISSCVEVFSLAAVLPFLAVLANPEKIWLNPLVISLRPIFSLESPSDLLLPITFLFGSASIVAACLRLLTLWSNGVFAAKIGSDISCDAYERTLYQPYDVQVSRNSSGIITALQIHVNQIINVIQSCLTLVSSGFILCSLLITLLFIDGRVAIISCLVFGLSYGIIVKYSNKKLLTNSKRIAYHNQLSVQNLQEGLGAIRDVILDGSQEIYLDSYRFSERPARIVAAQSVFIGVFPRYMMEAIGICLIGAIAYSLTTQYGGMEGALPLLGALALGAQRILPALQQVYNSWAIIRGSKTAVEIVISFLKQPMPNVLNNLKIIPYEFKNKIVFDNIYFSYKTINKQIIKGINFEICKGQRIGIIGSTGSGKSTTVDILMGLLKPTSGSLKVDGIDIHDTPIPRFLLEWRAAIAHVPQSIYLADKTIAENIAFGISKKEIDMERVIKSAQRAQLSSFIESMPNKYKSFIGERGIKLSGGQRQRIGIARALYKNASILIFDEATSSLDNRTESALMKIIEELNNELTIVMIAHRLTTVQRCNIIIEIDNGVVIRKGPPRLILN